MSTVPLEQLSYEVLAKLVNTTFRVQTAPGESIVLELCEATPQRIMVQSGANPSSYESFSLLFVGPVDRLLQQRMYSFESDKIGRFELFIVPVSRAQGGITYEAAFNRKIKQSSKPDQVTEAGRNASQS